MWGFVKNSHGVRLKTLQHRIILIHQTGFRAILTRTDALHWKNLKETPPGGHAAKLQCKNTLKSTVVLFNHAAQKNKSTADNVVYLKTFSRFKISVLSTACHRHKVDYNINFFPFFNKKCSITVFCKIIHGYCNGSKQK